MPDFQNGKIYKLVSDNTNKIYIGSTTMTLNDRLQRHKSNFKNNESSNSAKKLMRYDDVKIILLLDYPCNNKVELLLKEQEYMDLNKNICVNFRRAKVDKKEYMKQYMKDKNNIKNHIEAVKRYVNKNKEYIYGRAKEKILCLYCDIYHRRGNKASHYKSKKHLNSVSFINELFNNIE